MGTVLYVGNLPYSTGEAALRSAFSRDGWTVTKVRIVGDRETGRARGFAFVELATEDQALEAMRAMNGFELEGRPLRVSAARENGRPSGAGPDWADDEGGW